MGEPCSPGTKPVEHRDCIEELLRFTLQSRLNDDVEFDLGLSKDFCTNLLKTGPDGTEKPPLYKLLAVALYGAINSGELQGNSGKEDLCEREDDLNQKDQWKTLLLDVGSELTNVLKRIDFELHVQEPHFTQLKDCLKTVEGRCAAADYKRIKSGALLLFNKCLVLEVKDVHHYNSFSEMLESEGLANVLPGVKSISKGVAVYRKFYTEEKEKTNGVLSIRVAKPDSQPYISLARILSGLNHAGLQNLLSFHSAGITR